MYTTHSFAAAEIAARARKHVSSTASTISAHSVSADRAVLWPARSLTPIDFNTLLNLPGETLVEAMDINNAGQILARGFNGYYVFTPVPEPAAMAFDWLGSGTHDTRR